ncbi:MAG: glycine cleavage system protein H [Actinobacteria bacterium]|nr:glycine cleavage system protein H [Actinomycetota bacterium]
MAEINGCELPEELYYLLDKHVWARPMDGGVIRVGITSVAAKLSGGSLAAVTVSARKLGKEVPQGKSVATLESSKYVGPVPSPITGTLLHGNDALVGDPNLAVTDPYGEGWVADLQVEAFDPAGLVTGEEGIAAYREFLESEGVSCD